MALIQCPECRSDVSNEAPACPHCGLRLRPTFSNRLAEAWKNGLSLAQRGAVAYPVTWLAATLISLVLRDELYAIGEILPFLVLWSILTAIFGFLVSALAILVVAWLKYWLQEEGPERNVWSRSSLAVAVTWVVFAAWMVLTM